MDEKWEQRFQALRKRFDDLRDLWRAELLRVEGVLDGASSTWRRAADAASRRNLA
jgi:hypothetical protein